MAKRLKTALTPKQRAVRKTIARKFHSDAGKDCMAILDRLRFVCDEDPVPALRVLPGFRPGRSVFPRRQNSEWFQPYGHGQWFRAEKSRMQFYVESDRTEGWLAPYSVTLIADDRTGLLPEEVFAILEVMPTARLTMVELAIDFSPLTNVTCDFVLRHGVFGKSGRDLSSDNPMGDWWGTKKGGKRIKSYFKDQVFGHRVEFLLRSRFLRHYGIRDVFDFRRFKDLLPRHHILFARLDEQRLIARLGGTGFSSARTKGILRRVAERRRDLCPALTYLRRRIGIKNSRRLLVPLHTNKLVLQALQEWATMWPVAPGRLGKKRGQAR
jgi:hypothetical protein